MMPPGGQRALNDCLYLEIALIEGPLHRVKKWAEPDLTIKVSRVPCG